MAVTEEDVVWCYRSFLGRNPESAETALRHASSAKDFRSLVLLFVSCQEFRNKNAYPTWLPLNKGEMDLDVTASAADLSLMRDRIREAWTHLGDVRPHFSVLTNPSFLPESLDDNSLGRFYESGVAEVALIDAVLRRHGFSHPDSKTCVEFGCGLARVTLALATKFKKVHGYDISPNHLAIAEKRASDSGIHNVKFHLCPPDGIKKLEDCDFFYSRIVFQHNPPPLIKELIRTSLKSLRAGAIGIFQVPTYMQGYSFRIKEYLSSPRKLNLEMHCIPQSEIFSAIAEADCKLLEVREDGSTGLPGRWISNTFVVQRPGRAPRHSRRP